MYPPTLRSILTAFVFDISSRGQDDRRLHWTGRASGLHHWRCTVYVPYLISSTLYVDHWLYLHNTTHDFVLEVCTAFEIIDRQKG